MASIKIEGLKELQMALASHHTEIRQATAKALYATAVQIANKSGQLVPIDTGNLRSTRQIEFEDGLNMAAEISYGDTATPYAMVQHERTDYAHKGRRQAKYLEQPFLEETALWPQSLVDRVRAIYWKG